MEGTINDRMEMLVNERFDGNKAAFAKAIGMPPTMISTYVSKQRRSKPNVDIVTSIVTNLGVDPMWLLTGEASERNVASAAGDYSAAAINGDASVNASCDARLEGKVEFMQRLIDEKDKVIAEKERTIQILMQR